MRKELDYKKMWVKLKSEAIYDINRILDTKIEMSISDIMLSLSSKVIIQTMDYIESFELNENKKK